VLHNEQEARTVKFTTKISQFIISIRFFLYAILGFTIVGLLLYFVSTEVSKNRRENATVLAEKADEQYSEWITEEDEQEKSKLEAKLFEDTEVILRAYPKQYASQRALYIRGSVFYKKEDWQKASDEFMRLNESFPNSYLGAEALFFAAICQEELDNPDEAIKLYTKFTESYSNSPRIAHAYFSLGRLSETKENYQEAKGFYNTLKLDFPSSNWTNLAIDRIIDLTRRGKISE
jgi:TolA-binding protein